MNSSPARTASTLRAMRDGAYREGVRACLPTMPGIFAWGMVTGMAMVKSGLTLWQALGMTFAVFAGSAQLAALPLIAANVPVWVVFLTAMVVNLRFVIFAAVVGPHFAHLPWHKRLWYGYLNADITMGIFPQRFPSASKVDSAGRIAFFSGIGYTNWCFWQAGSVAGILLASQIPQSWGIGFAGTLALLAILIPLVVNMAALSGVVVAGAVAVAAAGLPYRLGLLLAVILGMACAMLVDKLIDSEGKTS
ncbi:Predicted branched-chain amino acid permease (azaleucine resistance) [Noviherbaspirillum humi]|uniref:Predicted branched-chain amino acid permease (Azaleucine resistance) n=1 Tax=Noviherbaspirillum humi TaxID=1688639 RepID=A0A239E1A5_9BURK|nr:AzlC family ABC transporter permease [Noviherbaspirillum humi]SNS38505.1 Predicted branched-chain amino acid permease (azaleucine resistance) [Noviherbaspirillum humi]